MQNVKVDKNLKKQVDREETIRHYVLGYVLECIIKNDINVTVSIRRLLVYDLRVIDVDIFVLCLKKIRTNNLFGLGNTKKNYKKLKKSMIITQMSKEEQIYVIKKMQEFANEYDGIFVNSKISENSFLEK